MQLSLQFTGVEPKVVSWCFFQSAYESCSEFAAWAHGSCPSECLGDRIWMDLVNWYCNNRLNKKVNWCQLDSTGQNSRVSILSLAKRTIGNFRRCRTFYIHSRWIWRENLWGADLVRVSQERFCGQTKQNKIKQTLWYRMSMNIANCIHLATADVCWIVWHHMASPCFGTLGVFIILTLVRLCVQLEHTGLSKVLWSDLQTFMDWWRYLWIGCSKSDSQWMAISALHVSRVESFPLFSRVSLDEVWGCIHLDKLSMTALEGSLAVSGVLETSVEVPQMNLSTFGIFPDSGYFRIQSCYKFLGCILYTSPHNPTKAWLYLRLSNCCVRTIVVITIVMPYVLYPFGCFKCAYGMLCGDVAQASLQVWTFLGSFLSYYPFLSFLTLLHLVISPLFLSESLRRRQFGQWCGPNAGHLKRRIAQAKGWGSHEISRSSVHFWSPTWSLTQNTKLPRHHDQATSFKCHFLTS